VSFEENTIYHEEITTLIINGHSALSALAGRNRAKIDHLRHDDELRRMHLKPKFVHDLRLLNTSGDAIRAYVNTTGGRHAPCGSLHHHLSDETWLARVSVLWDNSVRPLRQRIQRDRVGCQTEGFRGIRFDDDIRNRKVRGTGVYQSDDGGSRLFARKKISRGDRYRATRCNCGLVDEEFKRSDFAQHEFLPVFAAASEGTYGQEEEYGYGGVRGPHDLLSGCLFEPHGA